MARGQINEGVQFVVDLADVICDYNNMIKEQITSTLKEHLRFPDFTDHLQQRGIADVVETLCLQILEANLDDVQPPKSRRSIEDINVGDVYVDIKTSDASLDFKMPNLISIDRLRKLDKELIYTFVIYNACENTIDRIFSLSVYELNWDHLAIQNLGKGQLQIKNMTKFLRSPKSSLEKEEWKQKLKSKAIEFYGKVKVDAQKRQDEWR
jgi:hypothetical protein